MDLGLTGRTALITGSSKGIGYASAWSLAREGCNVHLAARTEADLEKAKANIRGRFNVSVTIHCTDLSNGDVARALVEDCADIDILVNNAGAIPAGAKASAMDLPIPRVPPVTSATGISISFHNKGHPTLYGHISCAIPDQQCDVGKARTTLFALGLEFGRNRERGLALAGSRSYDGAGRMTWPT